LVELWPIVERAVVALIVLGAALYLYLHWSGAIARFRDRRRPDVRTRDLLRKKQPPSSDDDCCR